MLYSSILYQSRFNPHAIAVSYGKHDLTYAEFSVHIEKITCRLNALTLRSSACVAVNIVHPYLHWLVLIALGRLGLVSVSVPDVDKPGLLALLQAGTVLTDQDKSASGETLFIKVDAHWLTQALDDSSGFTERNQEPNDAVRIILSSGTTGISKKILFTNDQLQKRLKNAVVVCGLSPTSRTMVTVGLDTLGGFQLPLSTWTSGGRAVLFIPGENLYQAVMRSDVNYLVMAPVQLGQFVEALPKDSQPITGLTVLVGGSALPPSISHKARLRLTPSLFVGYGSTEAGLVSYARAELADRYSGATGYVLPWSEVQVVDASGHQVPNGCAGELRIRNEGCVTGYLGAGDASKGTSTHSTPEETFKEGWFYPGDAGVLSDTGMLSIVGRTQELMNMGGVKIAPSMIEDVLLACPGVSDIAAFSMEQLNGTDLPWVAVVRGENYQQAILASSFQQQFPELPPLRFANIDKIQRNGMGKVLRNELRSLVQRELEQASNRIKEPQLG
jgi:acyl-CoA synthetase (AMP-forming)/AMP-acid ligase II